MFHVKFGFDWPRTSREEDPGQTGLYFETISNELCYDHKGGNILLTPDKGFQCQ